LTAVLRGMPLLALAASKGIARHRDRGRHVVRWPGNKKKTKNNRKNKKKKKKAPVPIS